MSRCNGDALTAREREIVAHLTAGRSTGDVAALLGLAEPTVRSHIRATIMKLGARSRAHAAVLVSTGPDGRAAPPRLEERQRRLLAELAAGKTVSAAARSLHVSRRTAHRWLEQARRTLDARSNLEAIVLLHRRQRGTD